MNITIGRSIKATIYVDNVYEGELDPKELNQIDSITWESWMQTWLRSLNDSSDLPQDCELSLRLSSDRQIQTLNHQYRAMDRPTDVLAFAATEAEITLPENIAEPLYLGDIIISLDTAARQAREQKHSLTVELAWLASHGLLHLLGWDHPDDDSLAQMLAEQSKLIQLLNMFCIE